MRNLKHQKQKTILIFQFLPILKFDNQYFIIKEMGKGEGGGGGTGGGRGVGEERDRMRGRWRREGEGEGGMEGD